MKWNKVVAMTTYDRSLRFIRRYFEAERNIISKLGGLFTAAANLL